MTELTWGYTSWVGPDMEVAGRIVAAQPGLIHKPSFVMQTLGRSPQQLEGETMRMLAPRVSRDPLARSMRHFAWSIALFLAVLSLLIPHTQALRLAAALVFALGTVLPKSFSWPFFALQRLLKAVLPATLVAVHSPSGTQRKSSRKRRRLRRFRRLDKERGDGPAEGRT